MDGWNQEVSLGASTIFQADNYLVQCISRGATLLYDAQVRPYGQACEGTMSCHDRLNILDIPGYNLIHVLSARKYIAMKAEKKHIAPRA